MFRDSHDIAIEWEAANYARAMELNDLLDACPDLPAKRVLYAAFTKDEQNGLMPEYGRRAADREFPVGAVVQPKSGSKGILFKQLGNNWERATEYHLGLATIVEIPEHGGQLRYVVIPSQEEPVEVATYNIDLVTKIRHVPK